MSKSLALSDTERSYHRLLNEQAAIGHSTTGSGSLLSIRPLAFSAGDGRRRHHLDRRCAHGHALAGRRHCRPDHTSVECTVPLWPRLPKPSGTRRRRQPSLGQGQPHRRTPLTTTAGASARPPPAHSRRDPPAAGRSGARVDRLCRGCPLRRGRRRSNGQIGRTGGQTGVPTDEAPSGPPDRRGDIAEYRFSGEVPGLGWLDYVRGVTDALARQRLALCSFDLRIASEVLSAGAAQVRGGTHPT